MTAESRRVVVIGGGPVGLTAAFLLACEGVEVTILERNREVPRDYRASTFHAGTMDLLEESGITAALMRMGLICPKFQYRSWDEGKIAELDVGLIADETRHPYRVQCEQYKLSEWLLGELFKRSNVELLLGYEVVGIEQAAGQVTVEARSAEGPIKVTGSYAIASDGGRSVSRKILGVNFPGFTYSDRMLVIGTSFNLRDRLPDIADVNYVSDPKNNGHILRIPDMWRMSLALTDDVTEETAKSVPYVKSRLEEVGLADALPGLKLASVYQVHQRIADTYRVGRVFLAGDSAHLNNPKGGMGLNGGLHDAFSLSKRLADVVLGRAGESHLDGYEQERRPEAMNGILKQTDANAQALRESDPAARQRVYSQWRALAADPAAARSHLLDSTMIASLRRSGLLKQPDAKH